MCIAPKPEMKYHGTLVFRPTALDYNINLRRENTTGGSPSRRVILIGICMRVQRKKGLDCTTRGLSTSLSLHTTIPRTSYLSFSPFSLASGSGSVLHVRPSIHPSPSLPPPPPPLDSVCSRLFSSHARSEQRYNDQIHKKKRRTNTIEACGRTSHIHHRAVQSLRNNARAPT